MIFRLFIVILCCSFAAKAFAVDGFVSAGFASGGTRMSNVTGGQDYNVRTGNGLFGSFGAILPVSATLPHRFELQFGVGYIFQDDQRDQAKAVSWSRVPLEAIYFYRNTQENFRIGYGLTYHVHNKLVGKGVNSPVTATFENALGWTAAIDKLFGTTGDLNKWAVGLKYTSIEYRSSAFTNKANGEGVAVTLSGFWF